MGITNKSDSKRFKAFGNSGRKYYAFREIVMDAFNHRCAVTGSAINLEMHHIDGDCSNNNGRNLIIVRKDIHQMMNNLNEQTFWYIMSGYIEHQENNQIITSEHCIMAKQDKIMNPRTGKYPLRGKLQFYCPKCLNTAKILVSEAKSGRTVFVCVNNKCIMLDVEFTAIYSTSHTE